jgi:hypothetical protein
MVLSFHTIALSLRDAFPWALAVALSQKAQHADLQVL